MGYLWLKTRSSEAVKIKTATVNLPEPATFRQTVDTLRTDPSWGARLSRQEYLEVINERNREWLGDGEVEPLEERLEEAYQEEETVCQS